MEKFIKLYACLYTGCNSLYVIDSQVKHEKEGAREGQTDGNYLMNIFTKAHSLRSDSQTSNSRGYNRDLEK